jgi:ribosomal protein L18
MENTLDPDTLHQLLDSQGCTGGKEYLKRCKKIGKEIADKTLSKKIAHANNISSDDEKVILNADNTLTVILSFNGNEKYKCACSAAVKPHGFHCKLT